MIPPSCSVAGASGEMAISTNSRTSCSRSISVTRLRRNTLSAPAPTSWITGSSPSDRPRPRRSLGETRPAPTFPARRSRSVMRPRASRRGARRSGASKSSATASCLRQIFSASTKGFRIQRRSARAPMAVTVSSSTHTSVPPSSPVRRGSTNSRFRRVISSRSIALPRRTICGRRRCPTPPGRISAT